MFGIDLVGISARHSYSQVFIHMRFKIGIGTVASYLNIYGNFKNKFPQ